MQLDVASAAVGLALGGISGGVSAWIAFRGFVARDTEREKSWWEWRRVVDDRLDGKREKIEAHERRITMLERNGHK